MPERRPLTNWAGNVEFRPARVHRPSSVEALRAVVADAASVRVLGTGHSFNRLADTAGDLVRLDGLPPVCAIDAERRTVTVAAGLSYAQVAERLQPTGLALRNLASLPHISVGGAVATGTHGSGDANQSLAAEVRALRVVGPGGDVVELSRDDRTGQLPGAVVNLGALGVVTHLTLDVIPAFDVAQDVYVGVSLDRALDRFRDVFASGYSVSIFTDWHRTASIWLKRQTTTEAGVAFPESPGRTWLGGTAARQAMHPVPGMPAANCTEQLGVPGPWHERLPHFRPAFTPSSGDELQSEFFVSRDDAPKAFVALRGLGHRIVPLLHVAEIRTVAADDLWLSPSHGRDSVALHFTWVSDAAAVRPVLAEVEARLAPLGARPHWGKVFTADPGAVAGGYERIADFRALARRLDPDGKFRNELVDRILSPGS